MVYTSIKSQERIYNIGDQIELTRFKEKIQGRLEKITQDTDVQGRSTIQIDGQSYILNEIKEHWIGLLTIKNNKLKLVSTLKTNQNPNQPNLNFYDPNQPFNKK